MQARTDLNLGCVVYSETENGIAAEWISNQNGKIRQGTGLGIRTDHQKPGNRFEGIFEVSYSDADGNKAPNLELTILFNLGYYTLTWSRDGIITDQGIGIMYDNKLVVSYAQVI